MRGTRIHSKSGESSLSLLKPLKVDNFKRNVRVGFFHMPDTGFFQGKYFDSPLREIFGVHHIKAHVFDNNVLITGANLSEDYFSDRQDRCIVIQDCEPLAHYLDDLINFLSDHSLLVNDSGDLTTLSQNKPVAYKQSKTFKNELSHHLRYFRFTHRTKF